MPKLTEKEVRSEYKNMRDNVPGFAELWPDTDKHFYEWCSGYLDYQHITEESTNAN